jgi:hypothetical protein
MQASLDDECARLREMPVEDDLLVGFELDQEVDDPPLDIDIAHREQEVLELAERKPANVAIVERHSIVSLRFDPLQVPQGSRNLQHHRSAPRRSQPRTPRLRTSRFRDGSFERCSRAKSFQSFPPPRGGDARDRARHLLGGIRRRLLRHLEAQTDPRFFGLRSNAAAGCPLVPRGVQEEVVVLGVVSEILF